MKNIVFTFIVFFFASYGSFAQNSTDLADNLTQTDEIKLNWMPNYKEALKKSRKEKKPILIYFTGSDWCGPCKILDKDLFHTEKFKNLADRDLILLQVNIPRSLDIISPEKMKANKVIQKKYRVKAFPTLMMVNHRGKKIAEKKGYIMTEYYYPFFKSVIAKY